MSDGGDPRFPFVSVAPLARQRCGGLIENWGAAKSNSQGRVVRAFMRGDLGMLAARERWSEWFLMSMSSRRPMGMMPISR
jgi:hypothetical protein